LQVITFPATDRPDLAMFLAQVRPSRSKSGPCRNAPGTCSSRGRGRHVGSAGERFGGGALLEGARDLWRHGRA